MSDTTSQTGTERKTPEEQLREMRGGLTMIFDKIEEMRDKVNTAAAPDDIRVFKEHFGLAQEKEPGYIEQANKILDDMTTTMQGVYNKIDEAVKSPEAPTIHTVIHMMAAFQKAATKHETSAQDVSLQETSLPCASPIEGDAPIPIQPVRLPCPSPVPSAGC